MTWTKIKVTSSWRIHVASNVCILLAQKYHQGLCTIQLIHFADSCPPETDDCPSTSRCLSLNGTGERICLQSCFLENGGCTDDEFCITSERDTDCDLSEPCSSVRCVESAGKYLSYPVVYTYVE